MANKEIHVVMVPYLGFGHLTPFRQFAITLAQKGIHVSFISTPKNIQKLAKIPTELAPLINMVEFQLSVDKNVIQNGAEATVDVPYEKMASLMRGYDLLIQQFKEFVMQQSPDWIIVDAHPIWAVEVAQELGVKVIMFSVFNAAFLTFMGLFEGLKEEREKRLRLLPESIMKSPEWVDFPSAVAYRRHEAAGFHFLCKIDGRKSLSERFVKVLDPCHAIAIRSCDEVESDYLRVLRNVARRPVFTVGLLLPEYKSEMEEIKKGIWRNMFKWLEDQEPRSVVFVGFGSECKLVKEEVQEIAYGLEMSKLPFLWMLQNPDWDVKDEDGDQGPLPAGFRSRTSSQGFVKFGWAPQKEILAHPSIACSLFHSGWGSAIENLQHGNSLVVLPLVYDQFLTARLLVEKGLAIEIDRKEEDGSFSRDDIAKSLKLAMFSKQGEELRNRAANVFGDPMLPLRHDHCVAKFVEYLKK